MFNVFSMDLITVLLLLEFSKILFWYIWLSAFVRTSAIAVSSAFLVSQPKEMDRSTPFILSFSIMDFTLLSMCPTAFESDLGKRITNSSPPILAIISSARHSLLRIWAAFCSSRSPAACPKASLTTFKPFTSATTIVNGRFLDVSNRLISSSINLRLYNPVN